LASTFFTGLVAAGIILSSISCMNSTDPDAVGLEFRSGVRNTPEPAPAVSAIGGNRLARIVGGYDGPACGVPRGAIQRNVSLLTLEVAPVVASPPCDAALVTYEYEATVTGLEPGTYNVEVYHRADPTRARQLAHTAAIIVQ
jgi:hypothetical protein